MRPSCFLQRLAKTITNGNSERPTATVCALGQGLNSLTNTKSERLNGRLQKTVGRQLEPEGPLLGPSRNRRRPDLQAERLPARIQQKTQSARFRQIRFCTFSGWLEQKTNFPEKTTPRFLQLGNNFLQVPSQFSADPHEVRKHFSTSP